MPDKDQFQQFEERIVRKIDESAEIIAQAVYKYVHKEFARMDDGFASLHRRLDDIDTRLERVEFLVTGHSQRLDVLEDRIRQVATKIGLTFN